MRDVSFANGHYYHIFNRGVDKRVIFKNDSDFWRFYISMYLFNDVHFMSNGGKSCAEIFDGVETDGLLREQGIHRDPLVKIVSFCLLRNHFHLFVQQLEEHGITKFLHRLSMGYAHYFNKKYERKGRLFESEFQAVLIKHDAHFLHMPRYIHLNALDTTAVPWREGKVVNWQIAMRFLDKYPWSSHQVYRGAPQPLGVVDKEMVKKLFRTRVEYYRFLKLWSSRLIKPTPLSGVH